MLKSIKIYTCTNGTLGLHLSRAPWDPYPWISSIQKESKSHIAGLRMGDCLLELNGIDVLGMKISEIADLLKNHWLNESSNYVTVVIWRNKSNAVGSVKYSDDADNCRVYDTDEDDDGADNEENSAHNINQQSLQKFATCLQHIAQLLECPVCLEVVKPPGWQCCNGHVLCNNCRSRSEKCPVCRVPLGPRGRCLLSDKLFTLLADSFPCDGVRSNKSSPKDKRKSTTEFHNQPKMTVAANPQQQETDGELKAKHFKSFFLRSDRRKALKEQQQSNKHKHDKAGNVTNAQNATITTMDSNELPFQAPSTKAKVHCYCATCYKSNIQKAIVNNGMQATATNKFILQVSVQQQQRPFLQEDKGKEDVQNDENEKYQNYQCPTGKLCCLSSKDMMPSIDATLSSLQQITNNNLSTEQLNAESALSSCEQPDNQPYQNMLKNEWDVFVHLSQKHHLYMLPYYAEYGQRIPINLHLNQTNTLTCLHLRSPPSPSDENDLNMVDKFFVACIPLEIDIDNKSKKVAIFLWHMSATAIPLTCNTLKDYETIIENPRTGIKWFGSSHPLTTPWSSIYNTKHFLIHEILELDNESATNTKSDIDGAGSKEENAFVIVIKSKEVRSK